MGHASDYLESGILFSIFKGAPFINIPEIAIALLTSPANDSDTGVTIADKEPPSSAGYQRQRVTIGAGWTFTPNAPEGGNISGLMSNAGTITFGPAVGSDWGWISGIAITDSGVRGSGNLLYHGVAAVPKYVGVDDTLSFSPGNLDVFYG